MESLARHYEVSTGTRWCDLPEKVRLAILFGSGDEVMTFAYDDGLRSYETSKSFEGVVPNMERRWRETDSDWVRDELSRYQSDKACQACDGHRLKPEALAVKIERPSAKRRWTRRSGPSSKGSETSSRVSFPFRCLP